MGNTIKQKALSGVKWTGIHFAGRFAISFGLSIILARILEPEEFGIMGMITIFTSIATVFINSGLSSALIRSKDTTQEDYTTVFYFNLVVSTFFYAILFISAPYIAHFFKELILIPVTRLISLVFLVNAWGIVQNAILVKKVDFKTQTIANLIGLLGSAIIASIMAFNKFGVYSIVGQAVSQALITTVYLWLSSKWRPQGFFHKQSLKKMWAFSSKILATSIVTSMLNQIDNVVIGKLFNSYQLGLYTRGKSTSQLPESIFSGVLGAVSFSVLSEVNDNKSEILRIHLKLFKLTLFLLLPIIGGLIASSEAFIITLYSEKWILSIPIIRVIAFTAVPTVLGIFFSQTIMAKGDANLYLKLNTLKKSLSLLAIPFGYYFGLYPFIYAILTTSILSLIIDFIYVSKLMEIKQSTYFLLFIKPFLVSSVMTTIVYLVNYLPIESNFVTFSLQVIVGVTTYLGMSLLFNSNELIYLKEIVLNRIKKDK